MLKKGGAAMDPKELSEQELAEVKRAMEEFAQDGWSAPRKRPKKHHRKGSLPVKPILLLSAMLFVLVALAVVIGICSKSDEPSAQVGTSNTTESSTGSTQLIVPPVLPSSEATETPTQETEPITEATEPATEATEAPTQPPIELPNGTPLSGSKLNALQTMFSWPSLYASVSLHSFSDPAELNLQVLIGDEASDQTSGKLTAAEKDYLAAISEEYLYLDAYRVPKAVAAWVVEQYYGLSLDDIPSAQTSVYWKETNSYYFIQDTNFCQLSITHAVELENGSIWVRYADTHSDHAGEMTLKPTADGYQILSNQTTR